MMDATVAQCRAVIQKSSLLSALSWLRSLEALGVCRCPARRCEALISQSCAQRRGVRARHLEHQGSLNTALFLFFFLPYFGVWKWDFVEFLKILSFFVTAISCSGAKSTAGLVQSHRAGLVSPSAFQPGCLPKSFLLFLKKIRNHSESLWEQEGARGRKT